MVSIESTSRHSIRYPTPLLIAVCVLVALFSHTGMQGVDRQPASTSRAPRTVALYAAVGADLTLYHVDVDAATLTRQTTVTLPASVQYAWRHPSREYFYVAWSTTMPGSVVRAADSTSSRHGLSAFRIDPRSGALYPHGEPASLPSRPIHLTMDRTGAHVLVAYNDPSGVTVHRVKDDGTVGSRVEQAATLDAGVYAHQVRVDRSNNMVIVVARGNGPAADRPEDPGALKVFSYANGVLRNRASIAPGGGYDFQPRHLDFHPSRPWVFVSLERQNKLQVYEALKSGTLSTAPLFTKDTLAAPRGVRPGQALGTVHVHPNGRFVYLANRASGTTEFQGRRVFAGGENNIAVFSIDQQSGEPTLLENVDTRGSHPRTFALDPSGRMLVAANQNQVLVRDGGGVKTVPPRLAVYRVRENGTLDFARTYDLESGDGRVLFWMGLVPLG
jgi:6-phosphogluconolactonase (cycloisomerase 2 family)